MTARSALDEILARLERAYDFSEWHWQPHTPPDYVCISALLVQHAAWSNVERALARLRDANALSLAAVDALPERDLVELIRPIGMPTIKARRLHALAQLAGDHGGLDRLLALPTDELRRALLATHGIGPETADVIVLYAAGRPAFVIDAYTRRIFGRLELGPDGDTYDRWQRWFQNALPRDVETYRRYHGLLVFHAKRTCRPQPLCATCALLDLCPTGQRRVAP